MNSIETKQIGHQRKAREIIKLRLKCEKCKKEIAISYLNLKTYCNLCFQELKNELKLERNKNA